MTWQTTAAAELQAQRESQWLTVGFSYALAEMGHLGASTAQLNGARNFIQVFQNLWDKGEVHRSLPVKNLESYDAPIEQLKTPPEKHE